MRVLHALFGTLVNESLVEPLAFGEGPINAEGVYYGLAGSLSMAGFFLLIRLAERLHALRRRVPSEPERQNDPEARAASPGPFDADANCFFVRVAGRTHRIHAPDVVYMAAERDFTRIVCANDEHFVSESLKSLLGRSAGFGLVRVHKSFAVNIGRVERLTRTQVQLGDCRVPVGRRYWPALAETWPARSAPSVTL